MSSFGTVSLNEVRAMLDACAPGHVFRQHGDHYYLIAYKGLTFPTFPRGAHGKSNPEIQRGVVKKMAKFFGVLPCAKRELALT